MNQECLLSEEIICRALKGEVNGSEQQRLLKHLEGDCPACEKLLEEMAPGLEMLLLEKGLATHATASGNGSLSEAEKAALLKDVFCRMQSGQVRPARSAAWRIGIWFAGSALAAAVVIAALLGPLRAGLQWPRSGTKGPAEITSELSLQFLVINLNAQGQPEASSGINRGVYHQDDSLMFRYQVQSRSAVSLLRLGDDGKRELISSGARVSRPGVYDISSGNKPLVYSLAGLGGVQTFCAVESGKDGGAGEEAFGRVESLLAQARGQDPSRRIRGADIDCFQIKVEK